MRLIDADAIMYIDLNRDVKNGLKVFVAFKEDVDALPTIEAEHRWIPCSERFPSNNGCVLVSTGDWIEFGKYEDGVWSIWDCEHWDKWGSKGTIAWMPLPNPYKGGDSE